MKSKIENEFSCRPVTRADFREWLRMGRKLWPRHKNDLKPTFEDILESPRETAFICRSRAGEAAGFVNLSIRRDYVEGSRSSPVGYVEGIFVEKKFRNRGIARMLVRKAEQWARRRGCTELGSDTELRNTESQRFHKAVGFKEAEKIVAFIKKIR